MSAPESAENKVEDAKADAPVDSGVGVRFCLDAPLAPFWLLSPVRIRTGVDQTLENSRLTSCDSQDQTTDETAGEPSKPVTSSSVFSMFGGGAKKEKKDEDDDRGDNSGSAKAQRDAAAATKPEEVCASSPVQLLLGRF